MKRAWSLSGVFTALMVLAMACGGPTPTPTTLATATGGFNPVAPTASVLTPAATPTPTLVSTPTPTATPTATPIPAPTPVPPSASFSVDVRSGSAPVTVNFNNSSQGPITSVEWDFGDGTVNTDQSPTHRYTISGTYSIQLTVSGPGGKFISVLADAIKVEPGPLAGLEVSPSSATLAVQETTQFTAVAKDEFENVVPSAITWAIVGEGGTIDGDGQFTAGTVAGDFADIVVATVKTDTKDVTSRASVAVEPGPLSEVLVDPVETVLDIGATQPFTFMAFDQSGNEIPDALTSWTAPPDVATIGAGGLLTAGSKAGLFQGAIDVDGIKGTHRASGTADLAVNPGPLNSIHGVPSCAGATPLA